MPNQVAHAAVFIGDVPLATYALQPSESARKNFPGVNGGLVKIVSDQNIVVAEQLIYKVNEVNTSFSEMMALPNKQLDKNYWLPWCNNGRDLDLQLHFGVP